MTIFQILQVFHASLCPLGHGGYMEGETVYFRLDREKDRLVLGHGPKNVKAVG